MFPRITVMFSTIVGLWLPLMGAMVLFGQNTGEPLALAYIQEDAASVEIYFKTLDGTVTNLTQSVANEYAPSWSPDGQTLVYMSDQSGNFDIYALDMRDGVEWRLTDHNGMDTNPVWSPDGRTIAFLSEREGALNVHVMRPDGTDVTNITSFASGYHDIAWSPEGDKLAFGTSRLFVMNKDGTDLKTVDTMSPGNVYSRWSPDGRYVAYSLMRDPYILGIMRRDGATNRQVMTSSSRLMEWHPTQHMLLYVESEDGRDSLYTIDITTREKRRLQRGLGTIYGIVLSPDGRYVAVTRRMLRDGQRVSRVELLDIQMGYTIVMIEEPTLVSSVVWRPY